MEGKTVEVLKSLSPKESIISGVLLYFDNAVKQGGWESPVRCFSVREPRMGKHSPYLSLVSAQIGIKRQETFLEREQDK